VRVELFYTPGCEKCADARDDLKAAAQQTIPGITWCEVNALDEMDYAVKLGVVTFPALAIDGELVFASLPTSGQLRRALTKRKKG
jgi:hypothetical protein